MSEGVGKVSATTLAGVRVILTRPRHQCDRLMAMLRERGARACCLPVIEIEAPRDVGPAIEALEKISHFDIVIFTSANAVDGAIALKSDLAGSENLPAMAAVGPATRRALEAAGIAVAIFPPGEFSSTGLLRHPRLDPSVARGKKVLIVKGVGGRAVLLNALEAAGAAVTCVDVYRRSRPEVRISELLEETLSEFDLIVFTSGTAIEHLLELVSDAEKREILAMPSVVSSERIARIARKRGARRTPVVASGPEDEALVRAVETWREIRARQSN